ncbi:MAG: hypothetical protein KA765_01640 [Thermoflexales bacterium]|nr:hypothetical protein [Thermoflexales bacterium]
MDTLLFVVAIFAVVFGISYWLSRDNMRTIRGYLLREGAVNIVVTWDWFGGDRDSQVFNIEYTDRHGRASQTRCKISGWSGEIYWRDPPQI